MESNFVPQLRVVLNTVCGKRCLYCRPSGEAACPVAREKTLPVRKTWECIDHLVQEGVREVRLTGGDPAYYPHDDLAWLVGKISKLDLYRLSLITRSHRIGGCLASLKKAGLTRITFSLDSMDADRWTFVCGLDAGRKHEHRQLLETIDAAIGMGFTVNLNSVLLDATCSQEFPALVDFVRSRSIGLKIEEVIRDVGANGADGNLLHADLEGLKADLRHVALRTETSYVHGGLGHPMEVLHLKGGASVTWKMFSGGACYGSHCRTCGNFPCDDALMALRLLPDGRLQTCLKREDNLLDLAKGIDEGCAEAVLDKAFGVYRSAVRMDYGTIEMARRDCQARAERMVA